METIEHLMKNCHICPVGCGANRYSVSLGKCRCSSIPRAALASIHHGEEPSISGTRGSGTVFFSGCNMTCLFCQNHLISQTNFGKDISIDRLSEIFLEQQEKNVHNINLVSPTQYAPHIKAALQKAKLKGLSIPIIYNTNGYETIETIRSLEGLIDIYMPDLKYYADQYALSFSATPHYFQFASKALLEMVKQTGRNQFSEDGLMKKGTLIRHLVLPGCRKDSEKILDWVRKHLGHDVFISLLRQYTPMHQARGHKQLGRRITTFEYQKVCDYFLEIGLENGYIQSKSSASESYTPLFDLNGIKKSYTPGVEKD